MSGLFFACDLYRWFFLAWLAARRHVIKEKRGGTEHGDQGQYEHAKGRAFHGYFRRDGVSLHRRGGTQTAQ